MFPISHGKELAHHRRMNIDRLKWSNLTPWGRTHLCWASFVVGGFLLALVGAAVSRQPEGTCSGIGFGCQLSGPDLAVLIAIFIGPMVLVALGAGHALIGIAHAVIRRTGRRQLQPTEALRPVRTRR